LQRVFRDANRWGAFVACELSFISASYLYFERYPAGDTTSPANLVAYQDLISKKEWNITVAYKECYYADKYAAAENISTPTIYPESKCLQVKTGQRGRRGVFYFSKPASWRSTVERSKKPLACLFSFLFLLYFFCIHG